MSKWDKPKSYKEKLQFIQSVLNGNFEPLAQPSSYQVMHFAGDDPETFTVSCKTNPQWSKIMNRDEYEQWRSTLKDCDTVFIIKFEEYGTNEPLKDESQIKAEYEAERKQRIETAAKETKARKSKKNEPAKEIEVLKIDDNYFPLQPIPNHGKISEYGQTWKLRNN